jgi:hypothetical protein
MDPDISPVGVPLSTPVVGSSVAHEGSLPAITLHVCGPVPPVAVSVCEYGKPTTPLFSTVVVMVSGRFVHSSKMVAVALCAGVSESVSWNVSVVVPPANGVPLIVAVDALNVKPDGSVPEVICQ